MKPLWDSLGETRAVRVMMLASLAYLVVYALTSSWVLASLFDYRAFQNAWYDHAWELELVYEARLGEWSGRDLHYPRGPLWQGLAWLAAASGGDYTAAGTLARIDALFHLLAIAVVLFIAVRRVKGDGRRVALLWFFAAISWGAGVPTFRALLTALLVLLYLPPAEAEDEPAWRRPAMVAGLLAASLMISFDRFGLGALCLAAMAVTDAVHRRLAGDAPREAVTRALRTAVAIAVALLALALIGLALGASPVEYVAGQRALVASYATGMRTPWHVAVPPANIVALLLIGATLVGLGLRLRWDRRLVVWIAGSLPATLFGAVTADAGHMLMAILPLTYVLGIAAAEPRGAPTLRTASGVLAAIVVLGWLGTYPNAISVNPDVFRMALDVRRGELAPVPEFRSDHARAVGYARHLAATEHPRCMAAWPSLTVAHALAEIPGPTQLALRWNDAQQERLARDIAEADCPVYLHDMLSFDDIGGSWFLGPDFVAIVERYEKDRFLGPGIVVMRRRGEVLELPRRALGSDAVGGVQLVQVPGEIRVPLERPVPGDRVIRMEYRMELASWRAQLGGVPFAEWRFEREGEPHGEWQPLHHLRANEVSTVFLSPDPEAVERGWIAGERLTRERVADALRIRFTGQGRFSPDRVELALRSLTEIEGPPIPEPEPRACVREEDLLAAMHEGGAYSRMNAARPSVVHFHLDPSPHPFPLAEVFWPVRPCADTCFYAMAGVDADADAGDGIELEVHLIHAEHRDAARPPRDPGGPRRDVDRAARRPLARRALVAPDRRADARGRGERLRHHRGAAARALHRPALARRGARRGGGRRARGRGAGGGQGQSSSRAGAATLRYPLRVIEQTCLGLGVGVEVPRTVRIASRLRTDDDVHPLTDAERIVPAAGLPILIELVEHAGTVGTLELEVRGLDGAGAVRLGGPHLYDCDG